MGRFRLFLALQFASLMALISPEGTMDGIKGAGEEWGKKR